MLCFLFRLPYASGKPGFHVKAVSWERPNDPLTPMWIRQTPAVMDWLARYGQPEWDLYYNGEKNCIALRNRLGYWPEPIDVEAEYVPDDFDDPVPFNLVEA